MEATTFQVRGGWQAKAEGVGLAFYGATEEEALNRLEEGLKLYNRLVSDAHQEDKQT